MDAGVGPALFPVIKVGLGFFQALEAQAFQRCSLGMTDAGFDLAFAVRILDAARHGYRAVIGLCNSLREAKEKLHRREGRKAISDFEGATLKQDSTQCLWKTNCTTTEDPMAFAPSASWNPRSITHLANYPSLSSPTISSDESIFQGDRC